MKRDNGAEFGLMDLAELFSEVVQQEYFLDHFRGELKKEEKRPRRGVRPKVKRQATFGGFLAGRGQTQADGDDDDDDDDDGGSGKQYASYVADIAYFFPLLEFFIPFNGSFKFLQQREYSNLFD